MRFGVRFSSLNSYSTWPLNIPARIPLWPELCQLFKLATLPFQLVLYLVMAEISIFASRRSNPQFTPRLVLVWDPALGCYKSHSFWGRHSCP